MAEIPQTDIPNGELDDLSKDELMALVNDLRKENAEREAFTHSVADRVGRWTYWLFAGPGLYNATTKAWSQWFTWLKAPNRQAWPEEVSGQFVAALLSRMMKIGLLSLMAVIALPLLQTIILNRQNALFDRQNSFIAFEQTTKFQELLFQLPYDALGNEFVDYQAFPDSIDRWPAPNKAVVSQLINLGLKENEIVLNSLSPLLNDNNSSISSGALLAIYGIEEMSLLKGNYSKANLRGAFLRGADLSNADLSDADLSDADLLGANLQGAILRDAHLARANLGGANLLYADLRGAVIVDTEDVFIDGMLNRSLPFQIGQLCAARTLYGIKPDSLFARYKARCHEKFDPPNED